MADSETDLLVSGFTYLFWCFIDLDVQQSRANVGCVWVYVSNVVHVLSISIEPTRPRLRQGLNTLISASHCVCLCVVFRPLWLVSSPVLLRSKARDASCRSLPPVRPPATCERSSNRPRTSSVCLRERPFCSSTRYIALTSPSRSVTVQ